jgi:glycosyltransferase involved in cell wall biosynthesis
VRKHGFISLANVRHARRLLRRLEPDLLLTYNWGATEWALADRMPQRCRYIHVEDGFAVDESPERQHWRRVIARRLLLRHCERVIVPSLTLRDLATRWWRLPETRVFYIPNGIDCERFAAPPDTDYLGQLGIASGDAVVGTVAGLRPEKNLRRLVRAFSTLPRELAAKLVIVGDGPERARIAAVAAEHGLANQLVLTGRLAKPERILGRFDVFALSSDTEQMPNSILEAMAAGLAVAATDVGDVKRVLAPENGGFVVPRADEAALAASMRTLLQNRAERARIARANRERVRAHYALATMVARWDAVFAGRA